MWRVMNKPRFIYQVGHGGLSHTFADMFEDGDFMDITAFVNVLIFREQQGIPVAKVHLLFDTLIRLCSVDCVLKACPSVLHK